MIKEIEIAVEATKNFQKFNERVILVNFDDNEVTRTREMLIRDAVCGLNETCERISGNRTNEPVKTEVTYSNPNYASVRTQPQNYTQQNMPYNQYTPVPMTENQKYQTRSVYVPVPMTENQNKELTRLGYNGDRRLNSKEAGELIKNLRLGSEIDYE